MTTAARPAFEPARGGRRKGGRFSQLSKQHSGRELPPHTKMNYRQTTQDAPEEVRNHDLGGERERAATRGKNRDPLTRAHATSPSVSKQPRVDRIPAANLDAGDPLTGGEDEDEDFEEESDGDDTVVLAELENAEKERAEEQARKDREQKAEEGRVHMENILSGNPLLNITGPSQAQVNCEVKRRWEEDVVVKICVKGGHDQKKDKRFVNDKLRYIFHKKFMKKYMK